MTSVAGRDHWLEKLLINRSCKKAHLLFSVNDLEKEGKRTFVAHEILVNWHSNSRNKLCIIRRNHKYIVSMHITVSTVCVSVQYLVNCTWGFSPVLMWPCIYEAHLGSWSGCPDGLWARGWVVEWHWGGCSAGRVLEKKVWMRWWRTDCCWSPADSALEDDPSEAGTHADNTNQDW